MQFVCEFFQLVTNLQKIIECVYWKKSTYKWTHAVQTHTHVVQGSTVYIIYICILLYYILFLYPLMDIKVISMSWLLYWGCWFSRPPGVGGRECGIRASLNATKLAILTEIQLIFLNKCFLDYCKLLVNFQLWKIWFWHFLPVFLSL